MKVKKSLLLLTKIPPTGSSSLLVCTLLSLPPVLLLSLPWPTPKFPEPLLSARARALASPQLLELQERFVMFPAWLVCAPLSPAARMASATTTSLVGTAASAARLGTAAVLCLLALYLFV